MVICKFFLQGNCKFGNYCKNEHQITDDFSQAQQSTSILRQSHFGNQFQTQTAGNQFQTQTAGNQFQTQNTASKEKPSFGTVDVNTLVKSVVNDMTLAEKSGQWFLSCYAPFKDKPVFPGFEDHCFEEIRLGYYEARNNGTLEQYKQQLNMMVQQAHIRLKSLQNPTVDIVNILKNLYNTPVSSQANTSPGTSLFAGNTTGSSVFGQSTTFSKQGNSIFAQASQNIFSKPQEQANTQGNIFGGGNSSSLFSNQQTVFGNNQIQTTSGNIFGQSNTNPVLSSNSIFGQQTSAPVQSGSIFGAGTSPTNTFTASNNIFLGNQIPNVFGQSPQTSQSTSIFGSQNSTILQQPNVFNTAPVQTTAPSAFNMDNVQKPPNVFGTPPNIQTASMFNTQTTHPQQSPPISQAQSNIFGLQNPINLQQSPSQNIFVSPQNIQTTLAQPAQIFGTTVTPPSQQNIFAPPVNREINSPIFQQNMSNSPFIKNNSEVQSHSSNIFGGQTFNTAPQHQKEPIEEEIYSKIGNLTEEEIKWFQSDDLTDFNIPEKPPTYEMCFKV